MAQSINNQRGSLTVEQWTHKPLNVGLTVNPTQANYLFGVQAHPRHLKRSLAIHSPVFIVNSPG